MPTLVCSALAACRSGLPSPSGKSWRTVGNWLYRPTPTRTAVVSVAAHRPLKRGSTATFA